VNSVAIVDYDCLCSTGSTLETAWDNMSRNRSGISEITRYSPSGETLMGLSAASFGGQIPMSYDELAGTGDSFRKWAEPGYHAVNTLCRRILKRLDFDISGHDPQRIAVLGGTALTSQYSRELVVKTQKPDSKFILNQCQNIPLAAAASEFGLQGPCFTIGSACASSGHAMLLGSQFIRWGVVDCAFVTGFDFPIMPYSMAGLDWVNAIYRRDQEQDRAYSDPAQASRPFSRDRQGFVPAEGAGAVFLSGEAYARTAGWPIRGYVRGGYSNSDAGHLTRPSVDNVSLCMTRALEDSGCNSEDVSCINAHATSTPIGDGNELGALCRVFGDRLKRTPVVANKSQIGHSLGAASVLGVIFSAHSMSKNVVLPTLNHIPDPALPEAFIPPKAIEYPHRVTLQNSFGFGGTNVSLVIEGPR